MGGGILVCLDDNGATGSSSLCSRKGILLWPNRWFRRQCLQSEEAYLLKKKPSQAAVTLLDIHEAGSADVKELQSTCNRTLISYDNEEAHTFPCQASCKRKKVEGHLTTQTNQCLDSFVMYDASETMETETLVSGNETCAMAGKKDQLMWPGSTSTQQLGIFSVVHMLSIKENQQLALSENLLPYLVCLSWHLKCDERKKIKNSLGNVYISAAPPSLKVAAKSVLALVYGFDVVLKQ